jgi:hypothetical protein
MSDDTDEMELVVSPPLPLLLPPPPPPPLSEP